MYKKTQISQSKNHSKGRSPILLTLAILTLILFSLSFTSALGFDNGLKYENSNLKVSVKNGYWFKIGEWIGLSESLGTIELKSHSSITEILKVPFGKEEVVMYYDFAFHKLYKNGLGNVEFIDMETGKKIDKDYSFVEWKEIDVPNYVQSCVDKFAINGTKSTKCSTIEDGTKKEFQWVEYNGKDIPNRNIRIGLKTYVSKDDYVDGVWTIAGKKVKKHASWTASLNVGLTAFYKFDEGSGTIIDSLGVANGTNSNAGNITGIVKSAYGYGGASFLNITGDRSHFPSGAENITVSCWVNQNQTDADVRYIFSIGQPFGGSGDFGFDINRRNGGVLGFTTIGAGNDIISTTNISEDQGVWKNILVERVSSTGYNLWYDGASVHNGTVSASSIVNSIVRFGADSESPASWIGGIDECGIWNRSLSGSEKEVVFAEGTYTNVFPATVNLDSPENNANFTLTNNVTHNATIFDTENNITNVTFWLDDQINATNLTAGLNNTVWTFDVVNIADGDHTWDIEACNFNNLCGNSSGGQRTYTVNTTPNIQYGAGVPINGFNSSDNFFEVNITITEDLFKNITFDLYNVNGILNQTVTFTNGSRSQNWSNLPDTTYSYNVTVATTTNQFNSTETRNITIDINPPVITLTSPTGNQGSFSSGINLTLAWNVTDENLDTCQYDYDGSNTTVNCALNITNLTVTDSTATSLIFYANDTFGNINFESTSWSYSFAENNVTFNENSSETDSQFFEINLSTSLNVSAISAQLNYNGSAFISSATCDEFCLVNNTIDIPLTFTGGSEDKDFFWQIDIFNGTDSISINTSTRQQNVSRIHLEECNATFSTEALNFTTYDEQNLSRIDPFLFDGDFDQWLGSGTVKRQSNFTNSSTSDFDLCISPTDETYFIDSTIEYDEAGNASLYTLRNYYFQNDTISNVGQDIFMYLLQSSSSTSFILKVQDDALLPVEGVLIETNRFYPGLNEFRIVQIAKSDQLGKSVGFFETEIVDYKFIISLNNDTLLETGLQKVIPESSPFTLTFNLGDNLGEPWGSQTDIEDLISTLVWDDSTGIITYTYTDSSTNLTLARLFVMQQSLVNSSADSTICNVNSSLTSAILTCDVGNSSGFYTASSFITRDSVESLDLQIGFQIETLSLIVGLLGLFYGWFLILIASFMFKFNEIAGIWAITIVVLMVNLIGLINFGGVFVTAIIGVAIFLTWLMSN